MAAFDKAWFAKNKVVVIGGIAGVGIVVYLYVKNKGSGGLGSSSSGSSATDPTTGLPASMDNQVDPATGMTYLQEAQQYGSVAAAQQAIASGSAYSSSVYGSGYGGGGTSGYPTLGGVYGNAPVTGSNYASNAAWAQAVTAGLVNLGYNSQDVATALGLFFAQQPLGVASDGVSYASIIQAAEAEFGPPPQGTYSIVPQNTNTTTPPGQTNPGGPATGTTVTVPNVVGDRVDVANPALKAVGLTSTLSQTRKANVAYWVTAQNPTAGSSVNKGSNVLLTISSTNPGITNPGGPNVPATSGASTNGALTQATFNPSNYIVVGSSYGPEYGSPTGPSLDYTGLPANQGYNIENDPAYAGVSPPINSWTVYTGTVYAQRVDGSFTAFPNLAAYLNAANAANSTSTPAMQRFTGMLRRAPNMSNDRDLLIAALGQVWSGPA